MIKFPITPEGYKKLEKEIKDLKHNDRPEIIEAIAEAREHGDLSENAEYHAARERQSFVEGKILDLEDKFSRADIIDSSKFSNDSIKFGATVELINDETEEKEIYHIVGEYEADTNKGRISVQSPLAKALIGKTVGDFIEFSTPRGIKSYEVLKISYQKIEL